jgi:stage III sporulation protein AB
MIILKYIFLMLILCGSSVVGVLISKKFKNRVNELREFKNVLNILEAKIKFTYEPLGDIFGEISEMTNNSKNAISKIFKEVKQKMQDFDVNTSWEESLESSKSALNLNGEDIDILKSLGNLLRKD